MTTFADLCSGGGLASLGAIQAGCRPLWAVEADAAIADVYARNIGDHVTVGRVQDVDPRRFERPDILWASPPCPSFSIAKANREETAEDIALAESICGFLRVLQPPAFLLENVPGYGKSCSLLKIRRELEHLGYWHQVSLVNSADYLVPQTRRRLILRALRDGMLPPLPPPVRPWKGWYQAIEDLLPTLPESRFAPWQLRRLPPEVFTCLVESRNGNQQYGDGLRPSLEPATAVVASSYGAHAGKAFLVNSAFPESNGKKHFERTDPAYTVDTQALTRTRALLVDCQNNGSPDADGNRGLTVRPDTQPAYTITGSHNHRVGRAWLEAGKVVSLTPRALARFQTLPDDYELPAKTALACRIIGNGVPVLLAQRLIEQIMEALP